MAYRIYVAVSKDRKLPIFDMDIETGRLQLLEEVALHGGPGPLAISPQWQYLYVGIRVGTDRGIYSFRVDRESGAVTKIGAVALESDPCFISTDVTGRFLLSAYHSAGKVAVHPIGEDGVVGGSPIEWRDTAPKAHCIMTDAANRFVFVPHAGEANAIFQFGFDQESGKLTPNAVPTVSPEPGEGPRHCCFHPALDFVYGDNEQGSSVTVYRFDRAAGTLTPTQTVSTLPDHFDGDNACAQIHITPDGRFVYVSNRGHDSIAGFSTDAQSGELTAIGQQFTEVVPRAFNVGPDGRYLFVAGQGTGRLAAYRIDRNTGALNPLEIYEVGQTPLWVLPVKLA